jgi:hydroxyacylglutathione hydrolase
MTVGDVVTIRAGADNLMYLYQYDGTSALAVDPCEISPVVGQLGKLGLQLGTILVTHHHWDHIGAVAELKKRTGCTVVGGDKERIPGVDRVLADGDVVMAADREIQAIATPGHTRTSLCYYVQPSGTHKEGILWTGDTMFVSGCGRIGEGDAGTLYASLMKLAALPDETLVYCGHDYTLENCRFALTIEPDNQALKERLKEVQQLQKAGKLTVPSTIAREKATNPFLRAAEPAVKTAVGMAGADAAAVFAELRRRKDVF